MKGQKLSWTQEQEESHSLTKPLLRPFHLSLLVWIWPNERRGIFTPISHILFWLLRSLNHRLASLIFPNFKWNLGPKSPWGQKGHNFPYQGAEHAHLNGESCRQPRLWPQHPQQVLVDKADRLRERNVSAERMWCLPRACVWVINRWKRERSNCLLPCADRLEFIASLSQKSTSYCISQQTVIGGMEGVRPKRNWKGDKNQQKQPKPQTSHFVKGFS